MTEIENLRNLLAEARTRLGRSCMATHGYSCDHPGCNLVDSIDNALKQPVLPEGATGSYSPNEIKWGPSDNEIEWVPIDSGSRKTADINGLSIDIWREKGGWYWRVSNPDSLLPSEKEAEVAALTAIKP